MYITMVRMLKNPLQDPTSNKVMTSVTSKYCPSCKLTKSASEFQKSSRNANGLQSYCRPCSNAKNVACHKKNPVSRAANTARWREHHPLENQVATAKINHRNHAGSPKDPIVDAKIAEILTTPGIQCVYCGTAVNVGIDHIDALARGGLHRADKLQPCCFTCNNRKGTQTDAEFREQLRMEALGYKRCGHCRQFKPRDEFYKLHAIANGCTSSCKVCHDTARNIRRGKPAIIQ